MKIMRAVSEQVDAPGGEMCEVVLAHSSVCMHSNSGPSAGRKRDSLTTPSLGSSASSSNSAQNLVQQVRLSSWLGAESAKAPDSREPSAERGLFAAGSLGNKCGKCQNHEVEISKKGHARDCPFKKCDCLKCRLLDARSDILQVISGKETKLKGTKKDPNCGFCQNHGIKILRKGHVRSCHFGQERHFRLDNCFDCEVHYIRNEVNRLQIKMRRAMKEDRTLSEEQRKTAREAITRDEVEKVCDMARMARKKREGVLKAQQVALDAGESSTSAMAPGGPIIQPRAPRNSPLLMLAGSVAPFSSPAPAFHQQRRQQQQPKHLGQQQKQLQQPAAPQQYAAGVAIKSERGDFSLLGAADELDANSSASDDELFDHQQQQAHLSNLLVHKRASRISEPPAASQSLGPNVWRPWSQQHQQQIVAALAAHQQQQPQASQHAFTASSPPQLISNTAIDAGAESMASFGCPLLGTRALSNQAAPYLSQTALSPMGGPFQSSLATGGHLALPMDSSSPIGGQQQQQTPLEQQQLLYTIFRVLFDNLHQQQQQQSQHFNMP